MRAVVQLPIFAIVSLLIFRRPNAFSRTNRRRIQSAAPNQNLDIRSAVRDLTQSFQTPVTALPDATREVH